MPEVPDSHRDLLGAGVAVLTTLGPKGAPQSSPVWFLAEGDVLRLSLNTTRQKTKNLQRNPACTLVILDLENPYRYLEVRGEARLEADDDYAFADQVGAKYGADLRQMDGPGETRVAVTVDARRIVARDLSG